MQIASIQILRALAALCVAIGHAQVFLSIAAEHAGRPFVWCYILPWAAGVDLFFVVSGFIMVWSSEKLFGQTGAAQTFSIRRIARIVPLYWTLMAVVLLLNNLRGKEPLDPAAIATSFLFIPWEAAGPGVYRPIIELGWTLNYEMFFYALFALFLGASREKACLRVIGLISALVGVGLFVTPALPSLFVWTRPILLEFAIGVALALAMRRGLRLPPFAAVALVGAGIWLLHLDFFNSASHPATWVTPNDFSRVLFWGLPSAMIFAGAVSVRRAPRSTRDENLATRAGVALGDSSYALYLSHPMILGAFATFWTRSGLVWLAPPWTGVIIALALCILIALAAHRWFERPTTRALQKYIAGFRQTVRITFN